MVGLKVKSMKRDKALNKALNNRIKDSLSYGFEFQMMRRILVETERKKKHSFVLGLSLISMVSGGMIVATICFLMYYVPFSIHLTLPDISISPETQSLFILYCYIALLVLVLLGLDAYYRSLRQKKNEKES
jgi:cytochrome bd-type quinol oxidase subunit 2